MSNEKIGSREGSLDAPTRHPLDWKNPEFYEQAAIDKELERVFEICHGCRRCVSLCHAFPTLFDLVDASSTMEVDGVAKADYQKVVDQCYLCDLCYQTKCPYVPPHPWNVDFPHLMLRAKAARHERGETKLASKILSSTGAVGKIASIPIVVDVVNATNRAKPTRKILDKAFGVHPDARLPTFYSQTARRRLKNLDDDYHLPRLQKADSIVVVTGQGSFEAPDRSREFSALLHSKGIPHVLDVWGHDVNHDWVWWRKMLPYYLEKFCEG